MGKGLKIITILIFLATLGVLYFSSKIITELIAKREEVKTLNARVNTLEEEKTKLTAQVDSLTQTKERLERSLTSLRRERDSLALKLSSERRKVEELNSKIAVLNREKSSLQAQVNSLQGKMQDFTQELARLKEERTRWENKAKNAEKKIESLRQELAKYTGKVEIEKEGEVKLVPEIVKKVSGKVLDFKYPGVVAVKFGESVSLQPGTILYAFRKNKVIGKITIKEVYSTLIVARTEYENLGESLSKDDILKITRWVKEGGK